MDQRDSLDLEIKAVLLLKEASIDPDTSGMAFDTLPVPKMPKATRPEIVALDHATAQVEAMRSSLKFRHFPMISGLAGLRYGRPGLYLGRDAYMGYGLVGLQAQWNLFDGFKVRTEKELLERQINFIDIERTRQNEFFSRSFALARQQFRSTGDRLMAAESARNAAAALAEDYKNSLAAGTVTNADYLNSLSNLAQAELLAEQVKTMKKIALLKVMYAAGIIIKF
jgi:outer membrane protein TolC